MRAVSRERDVTGLVVGTNYFDYYNERRNILDLPFDDVSFVEIRDLFRILNHGTFMLRRKFYTPLRFLFASMNLTKNARDAAIHHFFSAVSFDHKPWITTTSSSLPRLGRSPRALYEMAIRRLASGYCRGIIATSRYARHRQERFLSGRFPDHAAAVMDKVRVLHPPQELIMTDYREKPVGHEITFAFIGAEFFRKGGKEVLAVFDELLEQGYPIRLNVVSSLEYGDYASGASKEDQAAALSIMRRHEGRIIHHARLPNDKVKELLLQSHVGFLPTYHDLFGYSVLEAQAAGCPVISTNVGALPEINDDRMGWLIELPLRNSREAPHETAKDRERISFDIRNALPGIIREICADPSMIARKGRAAWDRVKQEHDPRRNAAVLRDLYREAAR